MFYLKTLIFKHRFENHNAVKRVVFLALVTMDQAKKLITVSIIAKH